MNIEGSISTVGRHVSAVDEKEMALERIIEIAEQPDRVGWAMLAGASLIAGHVTPEQAVAAAAGI